MIEELSVRNFKRFGQLSVRMSSLTVLTGLNGSGKSTLLQSLLLIRQLAERPGATVIELNGVHGLTLGEALDVLHAGADKAEIEVTTVTSASGRQKFRFNVPDGRSLNLTVAEPDQHVPRELRGIGSEFTYLSAERLGPRDVFPVSAVDATHVGVGEQGQFLAQVLSQHEKDQVPPSLRHPSTELDGVITVRAQVEKWASDIIRPLQITADWPAGLSVSMIRYREPGLLSDGIRPPNMGFGVSYALPIIVAGVLTKPGALLVVENPEAHLHPAGQSRMGRFLGRVAGSGAQVIVETHSDHVINGIRLAAVEDLTVATDAVVVHFFGEAYPVTIEMTEKGGMTEWPPGFFDQLDDDLGRLARAKRR
jgi:predicted ATPase